MIDACLEKHGYHKQLSFPRGGQIYFIHEHLNQIFWFKLQWKASCKLNSTTTMFLSYLMYQAFCFCFEINLSCMEIPSEILPFGLLQSFVHFKWRMGTHCGISRTKMLYIESLCYENWLNNYLTLCFFSIKAQSRSKYWEIILYFPSRGNKLPFKWFKSVVDDDIE